MTNKPKSPTSSISVMVTVLNEQATISRLLEALGKQTLQPTAVIIVDGGSTDGTSQILKQWQKKKLPFRLLVKQQKGNRSVGRNTALKLATTAYVACTDAGCVPEKTWLEELVKKQKQTKAKVVAGYYRGLAKNGFQVAQVPYVLVMPDQVDEQTFLPATRSVLFDRGWLLKIGGFDQTLSDNEDYALAKKIEAIQKRSKTPVLSFAKKAVVGWIPRDTLRQFGWMIFRFARGDARAGIFRPKVLALFARYFIFLIWFLLAVSWQQWLLVASFVATCLFYIFWSVQKNYRYAKQNWYWLPVLQLTCDVSVMLGTIVGLLSY